MWIGAVNEDPTVCKAAQPGYFPVSTPAAPFGGRRRRTGEAISRSF